MYSFIQKYLNCLLINICICIHIYKLYGVCSKTSQRNLFKVLRVFWETCGWALSCRRITPCVRRPSRLFFIAFRSFVRVLQYCAELIVLPWGRNSIKSGPRQSKKNESITFRAVIVAFDFRGGGDELCFHCILVFLDSGV